MMRRERVVALLSCALPLVLLGVMLGGVGSAAWAQGGGPPAVPPGRGTIEGLVRSETGAPLSDVELIVQGTVHRTTTGVDGRFSFLRVPDGRQRLLVRRIGYTPVQRDVLMQAGQTLTLQFVMVRAALEMSPIEVLARRQPSDPRLAGFRARAATPGAGAIFTRERIEASSNRTVLDMIRTVPGLRIQPAARGSGLARTVRLRGNRCPPVVFIDGYAATGPEFDLESIDLHMVEGIEVYQSGASAPAEFFSNARGQEQCGVIAIWSRPAQPRPPRARPLSAEEVARLRAQARRADQVEQQATIENGEPSIAYPDSLHSAGTPGEVTLEFVVNVRGRIEWSTIEVVTESHPAFTRAVLEALAGTLWEPARFEGRAVPQLVRLPVRFNP